MLLYFQSKDENYGRAILENNLSITTEVKDVHPYTFYTPRILPVGQSHTCALPRAIHKGVQYSSPQCKQLFCPSGGI